jgi:hypothetical protein
LKTDGSSVYHRALDPRVLGTAQISLSIDGKAAYASVTDNVQAFRRILTRLRHRPNVPCLVVHEKSGSHSSNTLENGRSMRESLDPAMEWIVTEGRHSKITQVKCIRGSLHQQFLTLPTLYLVAQEPFPVLQLRILIKLEGRVTEMFPVNSILMNLRCTIIPSCAHANVSDSLHWSTPPEDSCSGLSKVIRVASGWAVWTCLWFAPHHILSS